MKNSYCFFSLVVILNEVKNLVRSLRCFASLNMTILLLLAVFFILSYLPAVFLAGAVNPASAQTVQDNLYSTDGTVNAVLVNGNTIYIGGEFTHVGPVTPGGAALDSATGLSDPVLPKVNGTVRAVILDGAGGWYIGGSFSSVGGVARNNIAHIKSDKTLDAAWNPNANDVVYALALSGSTLYAGEISQPSATAHGITLLRSM